MLPVAISLRRLASRQLPRLAQQSSSLAARSLLLQRQPRAISALIGNCASSFSSTAAPVHEVDELQELDEVVLEPLPLTSGFVDQKPISDFDLSPGTMHNLEKVGITHLFPVQTQSFDVMMKGSDIVGRSKTGSGKTLAFALPIVEKILANKNATRNPQAMILLPTRELALQVATEIKRISPQLRTIDVVGGVSYTIQENQLRRGVDILVGTPGRIMDLVNKGSLSLDDIEVSVLDEADMMLKFGFQEAVETILGWIPDQRQCVMWSATFPKWVSSMARKFLKDPVSIDLVGKEDNHVPATVAHKAIHAPVRNRIQVLENVLRYHNNGGQTLVFTETKQEADEIVNTLARKDMRALHGDLSQGMRTSTMADFRDGTVRTLVCTDIAARGLDIANVELVVQYRLPSDKESFVHRAGRTGRAGRSGKNVVFFDRQDAHEVFDFEKRYKFTFRHESQPSVEHVLDSAMLDAHAKLKTVPRESARLFEEAAQKLNAEQGVDALSSALAILCGFDSKKLQSLSMLTGRSRMQTVQVEGVKSAREVSTILSKFIDGNASRDIHSVDDSFVFDIAHGTMDQLREQFEMAGLEDVKVSAATELPRVLLEKGSLGGGSNRFGNDRNGGWRSNNRSGGNSRGRWGNNNRNDRSFSDRRERNFDSSFSKNNRSSSPARKSSFGRFSEGRSSSSGDKWSKSW